MKIAIFENEYDTLENSFLYLNNKFYSDRLEFKNFTRSQNLEDIQLIASYSLIIIDIDLSAQSELDGFGLIRKIELEVPLHPSILIMTGQELDSNYSEQNGLAKVYPILEKPVNFNKLRAEFLKLGIE